MGKLDELLLLISEDAPAGVDLRTLAADLTLERIEEARREIDPEADPSGQGQNADWGAVVRQCEEALRERSKSLELAALLADGWARRSGFEGVRDGLLLIHGLCERFWPQLHPGVEDGEIDLALRARWLNWLAAGSGFLRGVSAAPLLPGGALTWEGHELAELVDEQSTQADKSRYQELLERGLVGTEDWNAQLRSAGVPELMALHERVVESESALQGLRQLLEKLFGDDPGELPLLTPLADRLAEIREHVAGACAALSAPENEEPSDGRAAMSSGASAGAAAPPPGGIRSRAEALRALAEAAAYFRRAEPHSPIAALVARAVRWGSMPFEDVLQEVVTDPSALRHAWDTLGIEPKAK